MENNLKGDVMRKSMRSLAVGLCLLGSGVALAFTDTSSPSKLTQSQSRNSIKIIEMGGDSGLGKRVGVKIVASDGTERVYELKALSINDDPRALQPPEWAKQFNTLIGVEIKIPLSGTPPAP